MRWLLDGAHPNQGLLLRFRAGNGSRALGDPTDLSGYPRPFRQEGDRPDYVFEASRVVMGGDVIFSNGAQIEIVAGEVVSFGDGFSVGDGAHLTVSAGTLPGYCQ